VATPFEGGVGVSVAGQKLSKGARSASGSWVSAFQSKSLLLVLPGNTNSLAFTDPHAATPICWVARTRRNSTPAILGMGAIH